MAGYERSATTARAAGPRSLARTPLIGRDELIAALVDDLAGARLLTLTGPGGVGKTRVAQAIIRAEQAVARCCWVELAHVQTSELVAETVAGALGAQPGGVDAVDAIVDRLGADDVPARTGQLRAPRRGLRRAGRHPARRRSGPAGDCDQSRAARGRRRSAPAGAAAVRPRRRAAVRRACSRGRPRLRHHRSERGGGRPVVPSARRLAAVDRTRGRAASGTHRRTDRRGPGRRLRPVVQERDARAGAAPEPARDTGLEPRAPDTRRAGALPPAGSLPRFVRPRRGDRGDRRGGLARGTGPRRGGAARRPFAGHGPPDRRPSALPVAGPDPYLRRRTPGRRG